MKDIVNAAKQDPARSALNWLAVNHLPGSGIAVNNVSRQAYPEVTGYIVPTVLDYGEEQLAVVLANWLISVQRPDGGFVGPDGQQEPYLFDTAQVMRGLLAVIDVLPQAEQALRRAADWMVASADDGVIRPRGDSAWAQRYGDHISENIHLYALPPLLEAGRLLGDQRYTRCVERSLDYFQHKAGLLRFEFLTHFYGYVLDALIDLGRSDLARRGLQDVIDCQTRDGAIPAIPGANWFCSPGTAQLAIVGYKLGLTAFANAALDYLKLYQMPSGGFLGSYGKGAAYGATIEPSWACKYFLDACLLQRQTRPDERRSSFRTHTDGLAFINRRQREIRAQIFAQVGFGKYEEGDSVGARDAFVRAIRCDVRWAANRGILSIMARSLMPPKIGRLPRSGEQG